MKDNDYLFQELAEKMLELDVQTGKGLVPKYTKKLKNGDSEQKVLSHILLETISKPKFHRFIRDNNIQLHTNTLDAFKQFNSRKKKYRSPEEKALAVLNDRGYESSYDSLILFICSYSLPLLS